MPLESEQIVVQSPMSYTGSYRRLTRRWWGWLLLPVVWTLVTAWYVLFGILVVPWRLLRRGARKRRLAEARHREMMEAQRRRDG